MTCSFPLKKNPTCWVLISDIPALRKQTTGIAKALGIPYEEKIVARKKPWCWLPKRCYLGAFKQLTKKSHLLAPPWPDIIIACGQNTIPFSLAIRRANKGKTKLVYIQTPNINPNCFDLIIAPTHDQLNKPNLIETFGATHDLSTATLREAAKEFTPTFLHYPSPFLSIFIGGASKKYAFSAKQAALLANTIIEIAKNYHGTVLVSPSRRTGEENCHYLARRFQAQKNIYFYNGISKNPYMGLLALSETIMVTDDSVSMISEACFTGVPVYLLALPERIQRKKIEQFITEAIERNLVRYYQGSIESWNKEPLDEVNRILPQIKECL